MKHRSLVFLGAVLAAALLPALSLPSRAQNTAPALRTRRATITTGQLLALNATPISLVPAPGAGFTLIFEGAELYKPAGTAYGGIAAGEDVAIKYTDASGTAVATCEATGFLDQATAQVRYVRAFTAASAVSDLTPVANAALVAHMLTGEITTGDSALRVRVFYRIIPSVLT